MQVDVFISRHWLIILLLADVIDKPNNQQIWPIMLLPYFIGLTRQNTISQFTTSLSCSKLFDQYQVYLFLITYAIKPLNYKYDVEDEL